jgi:hypothetical protein
MTSPVLTPEEVREFISDKVESNHLLDGEEFTNTRIDLAIELAIGRFNMIPPVGSANIYMFPNKQILMYGTLAVLYEGQAALLARNHMSYSDGGISIPVEERMALYQQLAVMYGQAFETSARGLKIQMNLESGWGGVSSDYANFPLW